MENENARYSISLLYQKQDYNKLENMLRVLITVAKNDDEALGKALNCFESETKGYSLALKTVIRINIDL